jgi:tripartite-type tricarboxylate transporter receptor subunit TctC
MLSAKWFERVCLPVLLWALLFDASFADDYPIHPIRMLVPSAAGGPVDVSARRVAEKVSRSLGQPVIVENKPGAGGSVGAAAAARAKPDGYTVFVGAINSLCLTPLSYENLSYDPVRDFAPVTLGTRGSPILVVNINLPVRTLAEFVAYAKINSGKLSYGSPAVGSLQHLAMVQLEQLTGIRMVHIPYKDNTAQILTDVMAGHIQATVEFGHSAAAHIKAGKLRALVIVGDKRKPIVPDVPTSTEAGVPRFDVTGWHGYLVPVGTPPEVIHKLNAAIAAALRSQDYAEWATSMGSEIGGGTPQQFAALIHAEHARWGPLIRASGIKLE